MEGGGLVKCICWACGGGEMGWGEVRRKVWGRVCKGGGRTVVVGPCAPGEDLEQGEV